jgi:hypothetical protein
LLKRWPRLLGVALVPVFGSCAFILDFDELQHSGDDASAGSGGAAGDLGSGGVATGGTSGNAGTAGAGGAAGDGGPLGVPLSEFARRLAEAVCEGLDVCVGPAIELVIFGEDCVEFFSAALADGYVAPIAASVQSGDITYDPLGGAACIQTLLNAAQQEPPQCADFNAMIEDCKSSLGGLSDLNQPCGHRYECARGLRCDVSSGCPGVCQPFAQLGELCSVDAECDPTRGLYCRTVVDADGGVGDGGTRTCSEFVPLASACNTDQDKCEPGGLCMNRQCRRIADAFTARLGFDCYNSGSLCEPGLSCEFSGLPFNPLQQALCVAEKNGLETCKIAFPDECPAGHYCSANFLNAGGQCLALPGSENQPCAAHFAQSVGLAPPCAASLVCVAGICKPRRRLGESCDIHGQCYSSACRPASDGGSTCVAQGCP